MSRQASQLNSPIDFQKALPRSPCPMYTYSSYESWLQYRFDSFVIIVIEEYKIDFWKGLKGLFE